MRGPNTALVPAVIALAALSLVGCSVEPRGLTVDASTCALGQTSADAGTVTFAVTNPGDEVAGFALLDKSAVIGELVGLAPEASRALVITVAEGDYEARCIPATGADPITTGFTVTAGSSTHIITSDQRDAASAAYARSVTEQSMALDRSVADFAAAFGAGTATIEQYDTARTHWIALRPLSASYSDLIPALDAGKNDLISGEVWTGWQAIRGDLAQPQLTATERDALADALVHDTARVLERLETAPSLTAGQVAAGAVDLIDHAVVSLDDSAEVNASVAAARSAFDAVEPLAEPALATLINDRFDAAAGRGVADLDALAESLAQLEGVLA